MVVELRVSYGNFSGALMVVLCENLVMGKNIIINCGNKLRAI